MDRKELKQFSDKEWYYGNLSDGLQDGSGIKKERDGTIYCGEWKRNLRSGVGCLCSPDGGLIVAEWAEDRALDVKFRIWGSGGFAVFSGKIEKDILKEGTLFRSDGRLYHGIFSDLKGDDFNGEGALLWPDKRIYAGHWKKGGTDIGGVIRRADGRVTGTLSNVRKGYCVKSWHQESEKQFFYGITKDDEVRNSNGIIFYNNDEFFAGEMIGGQKNGNGIYRSTDGYVRIGEWINDVQQGWGICFKCIDEIIDIYIGDFEDGLFSGNGCMLRRKSGKWSFDYFGKWKSGKKSGKGFSNLGDDKLFIGEFRSNLMDGEGETILSDGTKSTSHWKEGVPDISLEEVYSFGPERSMYSKKEKIAQAVMNSLSDGDEFGDERYFVGIRADENGAYQRSLNVEAGCDYEVRIFYHNDALSSFETASAYAAKMKIYFTKQISRQGGGSVSASVSADNAVPPLVWDAITLSADEDLNISYKIASAKIHNGYKTNGHIMPQALFTDNGTLLGTNELNGELPPDSSGYVTFILHTSGIKKENSISFKQTAGTISKNKENNSANVQNQNISDNFAKGRKKKRSRIFIGVCAACVNNEFAKEVQAEIGEEIDVKFSFANNASENDIKISAVIPPCFEFVAGSSVLELSDGSRCKCSDNWISEGLMLPNFMADGEGSLCFKLRYLPDPGTSPNDIKVKAGIETADITMWGEMKFFER